MKQLLNKIWHITYAITMFIFIIIFGYYLIFKKFELIILLLVIWDLCFLFLSIWDIKKVFKKDQDSLAD